MSWRLAESLLQLRAEVDEAAPRRSRLSDGTIGDPAHSSRVSDHNPNSAGVVRALDITHDPANGCDAHQLAERVRQLGIAGHPALTDGAYVISRGRIASATADGERWDWEPYSGSNRHDKHAHVSVATTSAGYDSRRRWGVMADQPNHVTAARRLLRRAIAELRQTPRDRVVVRQVLAELRRQLRRLPRR